MVRPSGGAGTVRSPDTMWGAVSFTQQVTDQRFSSAPTSTAVASYSPIAVIWPTVNGRDAAWRPFRMNSISPSGVQSSHRLATS